MSLWRSLQQGTSQTLSNFRSTIFSTSKGICADMRNLLVPEARSVLGLFTAAMTGAFGIALLHPHNSFGNSPVWSLLRAMATERTWAILMVAEAVLKMYAIFSHRKPLELAAYVFGIWFWTAITTSFAVSNTIMPQMGLYAVAALANILLVLWTSAEIKHETGRNCTGIGSGGIGNGVHNRTLRVTGNTSHKPHYRFGIREDCRGCPYLSSPLRTGSHPQEMDGMRR